TRAQHSQTRSGPARRRARHTGPGGPKMATDLHIAQFNVAKIRFELDHPAMTDFTRNLTYINSLADASPGFVWRLKDDDGNSTSIRPYDDQRLLITFSVWESIEALTAFTYRHHHAALMTRRREWFEHLDVPYLVLW